MDKQQFIRAMFAFFGHASRFDEVYAEQQPQWDELFTHAGFNDNYELADRYRQEFYRQAVATPHKIYAEFSKFILANPRIREELFEEKLPSWEFCDLCRGNGYLGPIPVYRHELQIMVELDRTRDERIWQQLARRAYALAWELQEFGHAKVRKRLVSREAYAALAEAAAEGRFIRTYEELRPQLGRGKRVYRKCVCEAAIKVAALEPVTDGEIHFLKALEQQKNREFQAICDFHGIQIPPNSTFSQVNRLLQNSELGRVSDAFYTEPYTGSYDASGKKYNELRKSENTQIDRNGPSVRSGAFSGQMVQSYRQSTEIVTTGTPGALNGQL